MHVSSALAANVRNRRKHTSAVRGLRARTRLTVKLVKTLSSGGNITMPFALIGLNLRSGSYDGRSPCSAVAEAKSNPDARYRIFSLRGEAVDDFGTRGHSRSGR